MFSNRRKSLYEWKQRAKKCNLKRLPLFRISIVGIETFQYRTASSWHPEKGISQTDQRILGHGEAKIDASLKTFHSDKILSF